MNQWAAVILILGVVGSCSAMVVGTKHAGAPTTCELVVKP